MTEKINQKVSSNGRILIPKDWMDKLDIKDSSEVKMELDEDKNIIMLDEAKQSIFPND